MKINIESTKEIVNINGIPARVWIGKTESGIPMYCYVTRIEIAKEDEPSFEKELELVPDKCTKGFPVRPVM